MPQQANQTSRPIGPSPGFFDRRPLILQRLASRPGPLAGMRIRKKLVVLHTTFSVMLAVVLLLALRPAIRNLVAQAETEHATAILRAVAPILSRGAAHDSAEVAEIAGQYVVRTGSAPSLGIPEAVERAAHDQPGVPISSTSALLGPCAVLAVRAPGQGPALYALSAPNLAMRGAVTRLYVLLAASLVAMYALVAAALEVFVLPQSVYAPIRRMLAADAAVRDGKGTRELIAEAHIPSDELGEIMRSRNETVRRLRQHEAALADALSNLEAVATDLRRKNHLLEAATRNLADADRLASLGMMSAGIAHELNTPLAVLKGLVERLNADPRAGVSPEHAALMVRVVARLERLGDSLLDYARVRPPMTKCVGLHAVVEEALTLLRLDTEHAGVRFENRLSTDMHADCDPDRLMQVIVNLVRNAANAIRESGARTGVVVIDAETTSRGGRNWVSLRVTDDGPGIASDMLPRLFEPFASTRLDSRGTGLGLAVADGIVREHGGVLLARNRADRSGAVFEVMIPADDTPGETPREPSVSAEANHG